MKAARLVGPKHFEITDAPISRTRDGNCLIQLERWSVCGSDIRYEYGTTFPEEHYPTDTGVPCHELAGVIVESRSKLWREGQRVIVIPTSHAGLVEYYQSPPDRMIPIPDDGDPGDWLMCQPSGTVLFALQQAGTLLGSTVLIIGQGPIGLSFTAMTARAGARTVIAADLFDYRLQHARRLGATHTVNPSKQPLDQAIEDITNGTGPDITVEAAGYPDTLSAACKLVRPHGTILMFGGQQETGDPNPTVPIDARSLLYRNAKLISTAAGASGSVTNHIHQMVALKQRGWWDPAELITHRLPFDDLADAFRMYDTRADGILKAVMSMEPKPASAPGGRN